MLAHQFKVFLLFFSIAISSLGQANTEKEDTLPIKHQWGLNVGGPTGVGLTYRGFTTKFGWQTTLLAYSDSKEINLNGGLALLYTIERFSNGKQWYALFGSGFVTELFKHTKFYPGFGSGIEFLWLNKLSVSFGLSFVFLMPKTRILGYLPIPMPEIALTYEI